jgi:stearoyl-CoA desaturase (delta-9 desaturase)
VLLTNGEGYHNFHHRFPSDYRNGVRWYHWDPTKWLIWTLSLAGLTSGLKRTSRDTIDRVSADQLREATDRPRDA